jgi:hypothetical protein
MRGNTNLRGLVPKPNPSGGALPAARRRLFCTNYNSCLDRAVERKWQGFSCERCEAFRPVNWNHEDRREDELNCMALLMIIFYQRRYVHLSPGRIVERLERDTRFQQEFGGVFSV